MHVVWWHQQHHTREKSYTYLNWLALSQKCVFFCTSRSILLLLSILNIYLTGQSTWGVFLQSYLLLYQCYHMEWSSWTDSSHLWIHHADGFACNFHLQCPYNHCVEQEAYEDTYQFGSFGHGCFRPTHYCLACTMVSEVVQCSKPRIILQMSHYPERQGPNWPISWNSLSCLLKWHLLQRLKYFNCFFFFWRHKPGKSYYMWDLNWFLNL